MYFFYVDVFDHPNGVRPLTEDEHLYLRLCKLGVPEGVTLLEFEEPSEPQQPTPEIQEEQPSGEVPDEVTVECPDHRPCNFVKDDQFYFGCCKYCLLPARDGD
ncbi:uncharacterized protein [Miscanthus floridulus]|uniref:uncharacterized protein n=1 Tax=Miscanthus floridulus TaxID=154761 RepID=UPI003457B11D